MYRLTFMCTDNGQFDVNLQPQEMGAFTQALGNNEIYMTEKSGVWINLEKVRYFTVNEYADRPPGEIEKSLSPHEL